LVRILRYTDSQKILHFKVHLENYNSSNQATVQMVKSQTSNIK